MSTERAAAVCCGELVVVYRALSRSFNWLALSHALPSCRPCSRSVTPIAWPVKTQQPHPLPLVILAMHFGACGAISS